MKHLLTWSLRLLGRTPPRTRPARRTILALESLERRELLDASPPILPPLLPQGLFSPAISPKITLSPSTLPAAQIGIKYSQALTPSGGQAPYHFNLASGSLPAGVTLNAKTGALSGTPTNAGLFNFAVKVTDSSTGSGRPLSTTQSYTLTVQNPTARLLFLVQPGNAPTGTVPAFQVEAFDKNGKLLSNVTVQLSLSVIASVAPASLTTKGTTANNGVAKFSGVKIATRGRYRVMASAGSATVLSNVIDVSLLGRRSPA